MKTNAIAFLIAAVGASGSAFASTLLDITTPPVTGGINTGPVIDPNATQGQWFENSGVRPLEFYDNVLGSGGGASQSNAILGYVNSLGYDQMSGAITSFSIRATITNDLATQTGSWANGSNSLGESLITTNHHVSALYQTMLVAEFALGDLMRQPASWLTPYTPIAPYIIATNEDDLAWYGYNNDQGNYYVPAWDFGTIPLGQSATRQLNFTISGGGILPTEARHHILEDSLLDQEDLFTNRTTSLKISNWMDTINPDDGTAYDIHQLLSSNASVFSAIPEPSTTVPLGLLLGMVAFRRSRRHTMD